MKKENDRNFADEQPQTITNMNSELTKLQPSLPLLNDMLKRGDSNFMLNHIQDFFEGDASPANHIQIHI